MGIGFRVEQEILTLCTEVDSVGIGFRRASRESAREQLALGIGKQAHKAGRPSNKPFWRSSPFLFLEAQKVGFGLWGQKDRTRLW